MSLNLELASGQSIETPQTHGGQSAQPNPPTGSGHAPLDEGHRAARIMIVDDEPLNIKVARKYLQGAGYENFITTTESPAVVKMICDQQPDIILLDIMMPQVDGLVILKTIRGALALRHLPVIILTASTDAPTKHHALELGATDFIHKPVDPNELIPRVRNAITSSIYQNQLARHSQELEEAVRQRTAELEASREDIILCLARAAEFRDDDTGHHIDRVGRYSAVIASELRMGEQFVRSIGLAAQLHDVGKIGVPDAILLKPGKLDPEEFDIIKKHCGMGKKIIQPIPPNEWLELSTHTTKGADLLKTARSTVLDMASRIALTHHEKWNGTGYPLGLAGEDIPIEGRIVAVADVFDALSSKRPYKEPFTRDKCLAIMEEERGTKFDPKVLDAFIARIHEIVRIQIQIANLD